VDVSETWRTWKRGIEELAREEWEDESGDHIRKTAAKQRSRRPPSDKLRRKNSIALLAALLFVLVITSNDGNPRHCALYFTFCVYQRLSVWRRSRSGLLVMDVEAPGGALRCLTAVPLHAMIGQ
jgi:hypothetical protein